MKTFGRLAIRNIKKHDQVKVLPDESNDLAFACSSPEYQLSVQGYIVKCLDGKCISYLLKDGLTVKYYDRDISNESVNLRFKLEYKHLYPPDSRWGMYCGSVQTTYNYKREKGIRTDYYPSGNIHRTWTIYKTIDNTWIYNGKYEQLYEDGTIAVQGIFDQNRMMGPWEERSVEGGYILKNYSFMWNMMQGDQICFGKGKRTFSMSSDQLDGWFNLEHYNGVEASAYFDNGKINSHVFISYNDKVILDCNVIDGSLHGNARLVKGSDIIVCTFNHDNLIEAMTYGRDGHIRSKFNIKGQTEYYKTIYEDYTEEIFCMKGRLDGKCIRNMTNGIKHEVTYSKGKWKLAKVYEELVLMKEYRNTKRLDSRTNEKVNRMMFTIPTTFSKLSSQLSRTMDKLFVFDTMDNPAHSNPIELE